MAESDHETTGWDVIKDQLYSEEAIAFMDKCVSLGIEPPSIVGFEFEKGGIIVAEAEMAWEDKKVVYLTSDQVGDNKQIFEDEGWTVVTSNNDIESVLGGK